MGYGVTKGVSSIIIAAASLDDILAISLFSIFLGIGMSGAASGHGFFGVDPLINSILMGPFEIVSGVIAGIVVGSLLRLDCFSKLSTGKKAAICLLIATCLIFPLSYIELSSIAYLATITFASIGATKWGHIEAEEVEDYVSVLWRYV
jgi:hypothetical protein